MSTGRKLFIGVLFGKLIILAVVLGVWGESRLVWGDGVTYRELGRGIFTGRGFSHELQIMPLYPFFVGFFETYVWRGLIVLAVFQACAVAALAVVIYRIGLLLMPSSYALVAALGASFEPVASALHFLVMTETFLVLLLYLFTYWCLRYFDTVTVRLLIGASCALALSVLIKAVGVYLLIVPIMFLVFSRRHISISKRAMEVLLLLTFFALILAPWMYRNYVLTGTFKTTIEGAQNICGYQLPLIFAVDKKINITTQSVNSDLEYQQLVRRCQGQSELENIIWIVSTYPWAFVKANTLATLSLLTNDGFATAFQKPSPQLPPHHNYLTPLVFMGSMWKENIALAIAELSWLELLVIALGKLFRITLSVLALYGASVLLLRQRNRASLFILSVVVYLFSVTLISTAFAVGARLRYPLDPFLFLLAAYGYARLWGAWRTSLAR